MEAVAPCQHWQQETVHREPMITIWHKVDASQCKAHPALSTSTWSSIATYRATTVATDGKTTLSQQVIRPIQSMSSLSLSQKTHHYLHSLSWTYAKATNTKQSNLEASRHHLVLQLKECLNLKLMLTCHHAIKSIVTQENMTCRNSQQQYLHKRRDIDVASTILLSLVEKNLTSKCLTCLTWMR